MSIYITYNEPYIEPEYEINDEYQDIVKNHLIIKENNKFLHNKYKIIKENNEFLNKHIIIAESQEIIIRQNATLILLMSINICLVLRFIK